MANTTNFNWETPDDTDLVKDGAAAIRTLGSAIDTSLVDLKGGTTGQVLAKNSNTDMDFIWASDASGIPATIFDAKGDIIAASAADTAARLAVGANNTVLTADSSTATGLKWAAAAAPSWVGCVLTNSAAQSIANNTYTALTFNTESLDTDGFHSTSTNTNRITIPAGKAGKYLITVMATFTANGTGARELFLLVNDTQPSGTATRFSTEDQPNASFNSSLVGSIVLSLSEGDWVNASVFQASGGALNIFGNNANGGMLNMTATYLGA